MFVDGGVVLNIMPLATTRRLGKNSKDLILTKMKMTSFMAHASHAMGVLIDVVVVGFKVTRSTFFEIEGKSSYAMILGIDWTHTSECVLSTLHHKLMVLFGDKVEVIEADQNPFFTEVKMLEALFYSPHLGPISVPEGYES